MCFASSCSCCCLSLLFSALSFSLSEFGGNRRARTASLCILRQKAILELKAI
ncbi:hypothetical protein RHGRI_032931 [Rhododendron griersonianum]|uniref:Uncharacterized protein n=1 Tax=Rhododendron griersonianum TaxID=479676 RepID=A0AAV6IFY6_9ERIC|nr:hypothetical protein RHGRI_032931 [Rhododendron griersonianum]